MPSENKIPVISWLFKQLHDDFWSVILYTVIVYFTGGFTMPLIPGLNKVVVKLAQVSDAKQQKSAE